ncbi:MAG: DMT family transporter [SAR324 cluster bacterium]|jgi:drug/metabolite transporter (DMT)-like permease|uniref:EamA domain-containing protein n=1 Tax=marine metagenome TaxID=408172 RepID=A0A381UQA5_9ZZZZ|nr:DMT family transporter [SAR324 cluster bacterium]MDP7439474.1 DMT family transporter [SAR324 cluster bacterium]MDP7583345.1 DMT family transporter [SAR324 cluster bacterium]MDP7615744.1 DMT family transporter [SAR324 cluster bacterium]HBR60755.1 EamA family transporter [Deltaproteobacteria bacterium]|tara:strand:+ start:1751 stop:2632 length:882 start_codon:yes stop_codon:yes gene_type:complete
MDFRSILMGVSFSFIWSSAFTSAKIIVTAASPLMVLSLRFLISGLLGIALARMLGQKIQLNKGEWTVVVIIGISQNALYLAFNFIAMQWIEAGLAAIIASLLPLVVAGVCWFFLGEKTGFIGMLGLTVGFGGVLVIMLDKLSGSSASLGMTLCLIGVAALAAATLYVGRMMSSNKNVLMLVGLQMLVGSITLFPFSLIFETWSIEWSTSFLLAFLYTTLVPGLLGTLIWFFLVRRIGPVKAATFHFLNPFFGVLVAAIILSEPLSLRDGIGVTIIMAGILLVQLSRKKIAKMD